MIKFLRKIWNAFKFTKEHEEFIREFPELWNDITRL